MTTWFRFRDTLFAIFNYIVEVRPPDDCSRLMYSVVTERNPSNVTRTP
jgi:hypothetical protein